MSLIERIEEELKAAMRARDQDRTGVLRLTLASLRAAEKEVQRPLKEDEELHVLQRERKRRLESATAEVDELRKKRADRNRTGAAETADREELRKLAERLRNDARELHALAVRP